MYQVKLSIFYIIFLLQFIVAYSYSNTKVNENGNILSSNLSIKNKKNNFKNLNSGDIIDAKKEKNDIKIRKNMNKLYNTLFPDDIEKKNEKSNFDNKYEKEHFEDNSYRINIPIDEKDLNNKKLDKKSDTLKNTELFNNEMKIENIKNGDEITINKQNTFGILGNGEKMKSESKFAIFNYLKDFFQNSSYIKNFRNYIEIFFNKYDQRIMESTIFFNFDETLF
ncbi:conserved Plasmodium protein, unknown function [Plasmodium gallinaceum]|uniref:Uncharacterized protein n=1 Tax=Plasmodium gallinaceum TaxID=5849 RepID=A0A1J1GP86_PLAGA|nr:conserved Plasmodium protein, unknown function [Plasmodium gallinaceum]CRG94305.1 conserved Plasmodium protein, unknown function [Plasmodium gallinaceum]